MLWIRFLFVSVFTRPALATSPFRKADVKWGTTAAGHGRG